MTSQRIKLAAFDMDGTLLEEDSSWVAVHKHFGTSASGRASLALYSEGKIDYNEFMRRDIASWPKGATRDEIERVLSNYRIRKEARGTVSELKDKGVLVALVTSGIDILAKRVAADLELDHWVANGLAFDQSGRLTGEGIGLVDPNRKDLAFKAMLKRLGISASETMAVGDTVYDLRFLKAARLGFMLAHTTRVDDPAIVHIETLSEILDYV